MKADLCKFFLQELIELRQQFVITKGCGKIKTDEARAFQGYGICDDLLVDQIIFKKVHILRWGR